MASTITLQSKAYNGTPDSNGVQRHLELVCEQTKDVAANKSIIKWELKSIGGGSTSYATGPTTVYINGTKVYERARYGYATEKFPNIKGSVSGSIDVIHNTDGKKSITVSLTTAIYESRTNTVSSNWTLDNIPRQATLTSVPNFTDLDNPTITYSNPAGNAVIDLRVCIATDNTTVVVPYSEDLSKTGSTYTFTDDQLTDATREALRKTITGTSRTVYIYLQSKIGTVYYWDIWPCTLTMKESEFSKPTVTMNVTLNNGSLPSKFDGLYIQNKSRVDVTLTAQGKYNASITSLYADIDGKRYYATDSKPFTTSVIQGLEGVKVEGFAKDSREFTGSASKSIDVIPYSKPLVIPFDDENAILCYRSDGNGKKVSGSTSLWVKAKKFYYTVNGKNTCALQYRYKLSTEAWDDSKHKWADLIPKTDASTNQYNALIPDTVFDQKKSYTVQIRAMDDIGEYDLKTFDIPTEDVALHLGRGGKNVSIGSYCDYSEPYTFHSEWKAIFDEGIYGAIINQEVDGDVLDFAEKCQVGFTTIMLSADNEATFNPSLKNACGFVQKRTDGVIHIVLFTPGIIAQNQYLASGVWNGWHYIVG